MRSHLAATLLAALALIAVPGAPPHAGVSDQLKQGEIWRHCEHYFLAVEHYRASEDHYAIRDVSLEFIRTLKRFTPADEREVFLYGECLNLASGNATRAHEMIQREQDEDSEFFELARIDAENDSNASRFEYMKQLDGKRELEREAEIAEDSFKNLLELERARTIAAAMQYLGRFGRSLSAGGGYGDLGAYNNSTANPLAAWLQFASAAGGLYLSAVTPDAAAGGGLATAKGYGSPGTTIAPITSPTGAAPTGTTAAYPDPPADPPSEPGDNAAPVPSVPREPPRDAALQPAPHLDRACASYRVTDADVTLARVTNRCAAPIVFHWCWLPDGRASCTPNLLSDVIAGGRSEIIPGPDEAERPVAVYVVCDMSDRQRLCLK